VPTVIVESPFKTDTIILVNGEKFVAEEAENVLYARACLRDCLDRGEAPFASHLLYTQEGVLNDAVPEERRQGIEAGFEIAKRFDRRAFYVDRGFSSGMKWGLVNAWRLQQVCEVRMLGGRWNVGWLPEIPVAELVSALRETS